MCTSLSKSQHDHTSLCKIWPRPGLAREIFKGGTIVSRGWYRKFLRIKIRFPPMEISWNANSNGQNMLPQKLSPPQKLNHAPPELNCVVSLEMEWFYHNNCSLRSAISLVYFLSVLVFYRQKLSQVYKQPSSAWTSVAWNVGGCEPPKWAHVCGLGLFCSGTWVEAEEPLKSSFHRRRA